MEVKPWKLLRSTQVLHNKWFAVRRDECELPNGQIIDDYFVIERGNAVGIVAVTPDNMVVCNQEYRHGVQKILIENPMGFIDPGETPEAAAARELEEETGYTAKTFIHIATMDAAPSLQTSQYPVYLALDAELTGRVENNPRELLSQVLIPAAEIEQRIDAGEITSLWAIGAIDVALRWLRKNKRLSV